MNYLDYIKDLVDNGQEDCGQINVDFNRKTRQITISKKQVQEKKKTKSFSLT